MDTSSVYLSVACLAGRSEEARVLADVTERAERQHASRLAGVIRDVVVQAGWRLADLDLLAVGIGPGSFAGLRIGVTTVKALAFGLEKPVLGVSSLDAIAAAQQRVVSLPRQATATTQGLICPLVDAKRAQVFAALYRTRGGRLVRTSAYLLEPIERLLERAVVRRAASVLFAGDAVPLYAETIRARLSSRATCADESGGVPRAAHVGRLALTRWLSLFEEATPRATARWRAGEGDDLDALGPMYLYPPPATPHAVRGVESRAVRGIESRVTRKATTP